MLFTLFLIEKAQQYVEATGNKTNIEAIKRLEDGFDLEGVVELGQILPDMFTHYGPGFKNSLIGVVVGETEMDPATKTLAMIALQQGDQNIDKLLIGLLIHILN